MLAAINAAGLTDLYAGGPTLLFLPPTDHAFAVLPQAQRDALLADPAALAATLRSHTVGAYVPRGSLAPTPGGRFDRSFKNLNGETIRISGDYAINGGPGGGERIGSPTAHKSTRQRRVVSAGPIGKLSARPMETTR